MDDLIDTAGTMVKRAEALLEKGAASVSACPAHAVLSGPAVRRIEESEPEGSGRDEFDSGFHGKPGGTLDQNVVGEPKYKRKRYDPIQRGDFGQRFVCISFWKPGFWEAFQTHVSPISGEPDFGRLEEI